MNNVDDAGNEAYSTATIKVFASLATHWLILLTLAFSDEATKKNPFCWSAERPFGIIDALMVINTVFSLLLMAFWVIWSYFKFDTLKTQSAPL